MDPGCATRSRFRRNAFVRSCKPGGLRPAKCDFRIVSTCKQRRTGGSGSFGRFCAGPCYRRRSVYHTDPVPCTVNAVSLQLSSVGMGRLQKPPHDRLSSVGRHTGILRRHCCSYLPLTQCCYLYKFLPPLLVGMGGNISPFTSSVVAQTHQASVVFVCRGMPTTNAEAPPPLPTKSTYY